MSLLTYNLEYGRHLAGLCCRHHRPLTHPQAILLAMKTMSKSIHIFPLLSYMGMGLHYKCSSLILQN